MRLTYKAKYPDGEVLGDYTLEQFVGWGGFGEVYLAYRKKDLVARKYAVKIPRAGTVIDEETLRQEAEIGHRVSEHPNIVRFVAAEIVRLDDDDEDEVEILMVSEFCEGGSLKSLLSTRKGTLPEEEAVALIEAVCRGLAHLHSRTVYHRDLKPDNVLLHEGVPKIADFGISRITDKSRSYGQALGTDPYMSPEALEGTYSAAVDLWAIGVILYELLSGTRPFVGTDSPSLLAAIRKSEPAPLPNAISPYLREQVTALLTKNADERIKKVTSASAVADVLQGRGKPSEEPSLLSRRAVLIGAGAVVGIPILGYAGYALTHLNPNATKQEPTPTPIAATPTPKPSPVPKKGLTVAEARKLPATHPAPKTLAEYKAQLVQLPGGTFPMGGTTSSDEKPVHSVTLSPFVMGRTPVTVALWKEFCKTTGRTMPQLPDYPVWKGGWASVLDHPMVNVTWDDCKAYAEWAGLALPSEAQWEYAVRGGLSGKEYPWGDEMDDSKVWYSKMGGGNGTAPVSRSGNVFVNGYGLVDMSGNVWQWCSDWYGAYSSEAETDPTGASSGTRRVLRGGSWIIYDADFFRCALRYGYAPGNRSSNNGFRLSSPAL